MSSVSLVVHIKCGKTKTLKDVVSAFLPPRVLAIDLPKAIWYAFTYSTARKWASNDNIQGRNECQSFLPAAFVMGRGNVDQDRGRVCLGRSTVVLQY